MEIKGADLCKDWGHPIKWEFTYRSQAGEAVSVTDSEAFSRTMQMRGLDNVSEQPNSALDTYYFI